MSLISSFLNKISFTDKTVISFFERIDNPNLFFNHNLFIDYNNHFFFYDTKTNFSFFAVGKVESIQDHSLAENNFSFISNADESIKKSFPLFIGYKKFTDSQKENIWNDFQDENWFIPKFIFINNGNESFAIHNFIGNNFDEAEFEKFLSYKNDRYEFINELIKVKFVNFSTTKEEWELIVSSAKESISSGEIEKVVLARKAEILYQPEINPYAVLFNLLEKSNESVLFSIKEKNSIFLGATPEKLFSIKDNLIETEALAGTIARANNESEDIILDKNFLNDKKEIEEQQKVLDYIISKLKLFSDEIYFDKIPSIKKLNLIQHLHTKIAAKVNPSIKIIDLLNELHPTPAVCGYPKENALQIIDELENFDRGLYSGVFGWFNNYTAGEFYVGIRSALFQKNIANIFAGCGIVNGSIPEKEFYETELKMRPILDLFNYENKS